MSSADTTNILAMEPVETGEGAAARPRSLASIIFHDAFSQFGARIGAVWVSLLVVAAVFAPLVANSFPLVAKVDGHWEAPFLQYLVPADAVLLVTFFVGLVLWFLPKIPLPTRGAMLLWVVALSIPLALVPSIARDFSWYRQEYGGPLIFTALIIAGLVDLAALIGLPIMARFSRRQWLGLGILAALLVGLGVAFPIRPSMAVVYERYRNLEAAGRVEHAVYAPIPFSPTDRLRDVSNSELQAPSTKHWMGTEINGADVLSRMIHASRVALAIGFIATGIAIIVGCFVGGLMGYFSGRVDILGMRLIEIFEAIPTLFLLISCVAFFGRSLYLMMVIIGLTSWSSYARFVRAEFLRLRTQDFVHAAVAAGLPLRSVLFRHMLPNGLAPVLVSASFGVASAILSEATLSFLGLGLVDEPSWGDLLSQATGQGGTFTWWLAIFPGAAIFLTVFSYNLIGESLRDALDPKLRGSSSD